MKIAEMQRELEKAWEYQEHAQRGYDEASKLLDEFYKNLIVYIILNCPYIFEQYSKLTQPLGVLPQLPLTCNTVNVNPLT